MDARPGPTSEILQRAADLRADAADPVLRDGAPLAFPPLSTATVLRTKAVTALTLAANLAREARSRLGAGRGGAVTSDSSTDMHAPELPVGRVLHQALHTIRPFDAVSNDALALQALLQAQGYRSEIFAEHIDASLRDRVRTLDRLGSVDGEPLVYHVCTQAPRVVEPLVHRSGPLLLRHHNITPPSWFDGISAGHAAACRGARAELDRLARVARAGTGDSGYNADELRALGMRDVEVVPILLAEAAGAPAWTGGGGYAVTVGRVAPNKRIDFALRTVAAYQRAYDLGFGLVIVGSERGMERYAEACRDLARELGVRNVQWTGPVDEAEKQRLMAEADAYLCASDHEGFCVPLVESFRMGLPVVARATSAVTGTCGDALAVDTDDPSFLAAVLRVVVEDADLRARLLEVQAREAERFDPERVGRQVLDWAARHVTAP
ncbi:MAG: glycosyltransferase [Actinobacteria bacterium]|nr:glycosyltransferase [Actinomycetota bacterium]